MNVRVAAILSVLALGACQPQKPPCPPAPTEPQPRLMRERDAWYVTGLGPWAARMIQRGYLFAAYRPLRDGARSPVAVLRAVGPAAPGSATVRLVPQCQVLDDALEAEQAVEPIDATGSIKVGQCLARIVSQNASPPYVILDVGRAERLRPGDQYLILGQPLAQPGFVPLGLDTERDLRCLISEAPAGRKLITTRCMLDRPLPTDVSLTNGYAVFAPRP